MNKDMTRCQGCPLAKYGNRMVPGEYPPDARVLFVGSFPTQEDLAHGKVWSGDSGKAMATTYLALAGLERSEAAIDYAIRCQPPLKKGKPQLGPTVVDAAIEHCQAYDVESPRVELIVAQGPIALRKYYRGTLKPHELRGHVVPTGDDAQ